MEPPMLFGKIKHAGMSKQTAKKSDAWKVVKQGKDDHAYVLFLRNVLKYYLFFLWRLTDRLIQFVYWGVKGLKKYFTFLCWKMSRFAERWGQEEGKMTFSHSGSLTPRLLAAIGLSLAINTGTDIYSKVGSPQSHKRQLVLCLSLKCMHCQIHTNTHTHKIKKLGSVPQSDWDCNSFHHITFWWLFFTQPQRSMFWWHEGVKADMPWLKMHHAAPGDGVKSEARRIWA